jgi:two-component system response regulator QseB
MIKILFVEDDRMIGESTHILLQHEGFIVDWVRSGLHALDALSRHQYHVVLLDLGLPELEGMEVLKHIRQSSQQDNQIGVLIITARDGIKDRVKGLNQGADDYLVKPYEFEELIARINALLRRSQQATTALDCYEIADVRLYPVSHRLFKKDQEIEISSKEWAILEPMMSNPNQIFSKSHLEQKLYDWQSDISSNTIEVYVHHLRQKLGKDFIRTVRGFGYCIDHVRKEPA